MNTILVTGGGGYIGSHVAKFLVESKNRVIVFDNFSRGHREIISILRRYGDVVGFEGDLRNPADLEKVFKEQKIDFVMHLGAVCLVNESMEKPGFYFENNTVGTLNLLEAMRKNDVRKIVFSSTCAVYGESEYLPVNESHPIRPSNPYGESKFFAERILGWYGMRYGFKYIIFRYFNVCGADESGEIGDAKDPSELLLQNAVRGAMDIEDFSFTCSKVKTPDGTPIRDYVDVLDVVEAHSVAMKYLNNGGESEICNVGNGKGYSVQEIVREVEKIFQVDLRRKKGKERKGEYAEIYADSEKIKKLLNWKPKRTLEDSVRNLKSWYTKHPSGYSE